MVDELFLDISKVDQATMYNPSRRVRLWRQKMLIPAQALVPLHWPEAQSVPRVLNGYRKAGPSDGDCSLQDCVSHRPMNQWQWPAPRPMDRGEQSKRRRRLPSATSGRSWNSENCICCSTPS